MSRSHGLRFLAFSMAGAVATATHYAVLVAGQALATARSAAGSSEKSPWKAPHTSAWLRSRRPQPRHAHRLLLVPARGLKAAKILHWVGPVPAPPSIMTTIPIPGGMNPTATGLLHEGAGRVFSQSKRWSLYFIEQEYGCEQVRQARTEPTGDLLAPTLLPVARGFHIDSLHIIRAANTNGMFLVGGYNANYSV